MNFLPESEVVNLKYQLAQQIKASINRAAAGKSSNTPFLDSCVDTLIDEMAELKIEVSKLSLALSNITNTSYTHPEAIPENTVAKVSQNQDRERSLSFPIKLDPEYLQNIDNFYYPEESQNGKNFIWMGGGNKATVEFPVQLDTPIKVVLKNVRFINEATRKSFKLFINGEELEFDAEKQNEGYCITASWMPLHSSIKHKCVIELLVAQSVSVRDLYPDTSDTRKLCFALNEIEILNNVQEYVNA